MGLMEWWDYDLGGVVALGGVQKKYRGCKPRCGLVDRGAATPLPESATHARPFLVHALFPRNAHPVWGIFTIRRIHGPKGLRWSGTGDASAVHDDNLRLLQCPAAWAREGLVVVYVELRQ